MMRKFNIGDKVSVRFNLAYGYHIYIDLVAATYGMISDISQTSESPMYTIELDDEQGLVSNIYESDIRLRED